MRRALAVVGPEFEARSYDELRERPAEELSFAREFEGVQLSFSAETYAVRENADLCFCIDARGVPVFPYAEPSWQFSKRPDGSVYH